VKAHLDPLPTHISSEGDGDGDGQTH